MWAKLAGARAAALGAALAVLLAGTAARADTKEELAAAIDEVRSLHAEAESLFQRHREAEAALAEATRRLAEAQAAERAKAAEVGEARRAVGRAARASYTSAGLEGTLFLLLDRDSTTSARSMNDLRRLTDATIADLTTQRRLAAELEQLRRTIEHQRTAAERSARESEQLARQAAARLAEAERRQAQLQARYEAELAELRKQQEDEQRRALDEAQAKVAREAQRAPRQDIQPSRDQGSASGPGGSSGVRRAVVAWALSKVGSPYVFGAEGPHAYDCSGFVTAAYKRVGISLPSYTGAQAKLVAPIPLNQVQPGDLLFYFGKGAHHVAIALGDGRMVHAANPSRGVTINRLSDSWYRERFTSAGRLLPPD